MSIKFRAWHKELKCMRWVAEINFIEKRLIITNAHTFKNDPSNVFLFDEIELMQCAGLTDINDKDIYEGDILKSNHIHVIVKKIKGGFVLEDSAGWRIDGINGIHYNWEILGNIYENGDLLNV